MLQKSINKLLTLFPMTKKPTINWLIHELLDERNRLIKANLRLRKLLVMEKNHSRELYFERQARSGSRF